MVQFGDELRLQREQRGVSLETMCATTKLSLHQLSLLEASRYGELPGGIFRKGFVRSYLRELGLDEGPWLERFEASYRMSGFADTAEQDWANFAENVKNNRNGRKASGSRQQWLGVLAMIALLLALGACVWKFLVEPKVAQRSAAAAAQLIAVRADRAC
jgi:cytoskeletal protein RodZ